MLNNQRRTEANGWVLVAKFTCKNWTIWRWKSTVDLHNKTSSQVSIVMAIQLWNKNVKWEEVCVCIELTTKEKVELEYSKIFQVNWRSSRARKTTESCRWCKTEQISADLRVKDAKITVPADLQKSVIHQWSASSLCGNSSGQGQMGSGTGSWIM